MTNRVEHLFRYSLAIQVSCTCIVSQFPWVLQAWLSWAFGSGSHKVLARAAGLFPVTHGCWQNSLPCSRRTRGDSGQRESFAAASRASFKRLT